MTLNSDTTTAIESLETLLKAKIRLQDAQAEAEPVLEIVGLLFEPGILDEDQKNILRNGLKNLRKLLEAHTAYSEAVKQAEPARAIVNDLFGSQPRKPSTNGKMDSSSEDEAKAEAKPEAKAEDKPEAKPEAKAEPKAEGKTTAKGSDAAKAK